MTAPSTTGDEQTCRICGQPGTLLFEALLHERHCLVTDFAVRGWLSGDVTPANGLVRFIDPGALPALLRPLFETIRRTPGYGKPFAALAASRFNPDVFQSSVADMVASVVA